jgi:hypothetical protein
MSTLAELNTRLNRLNAAIDSGERTVALDDGSSVTYRSLDEMMATRRDLQTRIAAASGSGRSQGMVVMRPRFTTMRGG